MVGGSYPGVFIVLEGPEGAGKSTQLKLLAPWLEGQGYDVVTTREPGGTAVGDRIRAALFASLDTNILGITEAFLVNAARAQHVRELLRPSLEAGKIVVSDRYAASTIAYQGYGRGVDVTALRQLIDIATEGLQPDLTVYLDVPVELGLARKHQSPGAAGELNHMDHLEATFHRRVADGFQALIREDPERWRIVNASKSKDSVQQDLRRILADLLTQQGRALARF